MIRFVCLLHLTLGKIQAGQVRHFDCSFVGFRSYIIDYGPDIVNICSRWACCFALSLKSEISRGRVEQSNVLTTCGARAIVLYIIVLVKALKRSETATCVTPAEFSGEIENPVTRVVPEFGSTVAFSGNREATRAGAWTYPAGSDCKRES